MQCSTRLEEVDEGAPTCPRTVSTERDGQPPASEPPPGPVTANFEPPPDPQKSERPLKPEAFLARQRQLGSLGGKCAGSVGENKFLVQLAVDGRARCQLRTCKEPLKIGELRLGKRPPSLPVWKSTSASGAVLARSSGEEPASPRHRAGVASMAWRTTR